MKALPWILVILFALAVLFLWNHQHEPSPISKPDTIEYVDTIPFYFPIVRESIVIRYKTVKLPIKQDSCEAKQDSCMSSDSANVIIPIIQKEYEDSLYHLWVSGYDVSLDSIKVNSLTREITIPILAPAKRKRWGLGIQVGYSYPVGMYVGVGVSYNILMW